MEPPQVFFYAHALLDLASAFDFVVAKVNRWCYHVIARHIKAVDTGHLSGVWVRFACYLFRPRPHYSVNIFDCQPLCVMFFHFSLLHKMEVLTLTTFYKNYVALCAQRKKSPSAVASEIGLSRTSPNGWKNGKMPSDANLNRLAIYFDISVDELLEDKKETPAFSEEDERKTIEAILNSLSREELLDLMAKTAEKLKERGLG